MNDDASRPIRINEFLQQYWHELRGDRAMPFEDDVNPDVLKDIWSSCFLINRRGNAFAYSYLGDQLIEAYGDDLTGHEVAEALVYPHPKSLFEAFQRVCSERVPQLDENGFVNARGQHIRYRSCVLPLAARGHTDVAFLLGGMKWKVYEADAT